MDQTHTAKSTNWQSPLSWLSLRLILAVLSLLLSAQALLTDDIINKDGILYLKMAEAFMDGGLAAMGQLFDWPFFAFLIGGLSKLTGLHVEVSAGILNSLLFVVFTDALFQLTRTQVSAPRHLLIAAVLILCFFPINDYRDFVIRDIGYWAFISLALVQLIQFLETGRWRAAVGWQFAAMVALLFRIEGLVIMLTMPLLVLLRDPLALALKQLLRLHSVILIVSLAGGLMILFNGGIADAFSKITMITHFFDFAQIIDSFTQHAQAITQILHPAATDAASTVLFFGLLGMLFVHLFYGFSGPYLLIWLMSLSVTVPPERHSASKQVLVSFLIINLIILVLFTLSQFLVTTRYCIIALTVLFVLLMPRFCQFIEQALDKRRYWLAGFIGFLLFYALVDFVHQSHSKAYISKTAHWAATNLPDDAKVATFDVFSGYYFDKTNRTSDISIIESPAEVLTFDYVVMVEEQRQIPLSASLEDKVHLIKHFFSDNDDRSSVYKVIK